jgi:hypothetical protein
MQTEGHAKVQMPLQASITITVLPSGFLAEPSCNICRPWICLHFQKKSSICSIQSAPVQLFISFMGKGWNLAVR